MENCGSRNTITATAPSFLVYTILLVPTGLAALTVMVSANAMVQLSVDPAVRKEAYKAGLTMIADRAYAVPLWSLPTYYVASADLVFKAYPDEMPRFWEMSWK